MAKTLQATAATLLEAVSAALSEALRPVCSEYMALGTPVIFSCCECDDMGANGEISVHLRRLFDAEANSLVEVRRVRPCRGGVTAAQFRLVLARCSPIINEHGELPEPEEITAAALDQMHDTRLIWKALTTCDLELRIDDVSVDLSEPGMCSIIYADVAAQVIIPLA